MKTKYTYKIPSKFKVDKCFVLLKIGLYLNLRLNQRIDNKLLWKYYINYR